MTTQLHKVLLGHLAGIFAPVTSIASAEDLRRRLAAVGWDVDALAGVDVAAAVSAAQAAATAIETVAQTVQHGTGELGEYVDAAIALTAAAVQVISVLESWTPPAGLDADDLALLPADLLAGLLDAYLGLVAPRAVAVLQVLGVLRRVPAPAVARSDGVVVRKAMNRPEIDGAVLKRALTDPLGLLTDRFLTDDAGARLLAEGIADLVGPQLAELANAFGATGSYGVPGTGAGLGLTADELAAARHMLLLGYRAEADTEGVDVAAAFRLAAAFTDDTAGRGLGLVLAPAGELTVGAGPVQVTLSGEPEPVVVTGAGVDFVAGGGTSRLALTVGYAPPPTPGAPVARFGTADGTRFEIGAVKVTLTGELTPAAPDIGFTVELTGILLATAAGDGDGFLQKVLAAAPIRATADLAFDWSARKGLRVRGTGSLEIRIPAHLVIGPVTVDEAALLVGITDGGVLGRVTLAATLALGPIVATVTGIGLRVMVSPPAGGDAAALMKVGFQPPNGIGMSLDAGPVSGGGFILLDPDAGKYAGILHLEIADFIAITAIGLLSTRMPDGSDGFSLLIILTAEFPPIQLGFGFNLSGLGGLLGLNRTMSRPALQAGIRNGALDSILFPPDPVANANKVISDVEAIFPVAPGRFVIGLMVQVGWGAGPILTLDIGIIIEVPSPIKIALIGRLSLVLPTPDAAVAEIHMDLAGILDFGTKDASVDATIHDSRVAAFAISGDLAVRVNWGGSSTFALSAGGFHPDFDTPPGFPELRRLAISLATGDNPRLRLETYLAVTANTVQIGARLEVYAEVDAGPLGTFSASAYLGFDALVTLFPFAFTLDIYGGAVIKRNGHAILSATLAITLSGPDLWHAAGYAELDFFGKHRIPVEATAGQARELAAPVAGDPLGDLAAAIADRQHWSAQLPPDGAGLVSLRDFDPPAAPAHPLGELTFRQAAVPLRLDIDRYAEAPVPADGGRLDVSFAVATGPVTGAREVRDAFAPGQFLALSDAQKLSRPAFEQLICGYAGLGLAAVPVAHGPAVVGGAEYDTVVVDAAEPTRAAAYTPAAALVAHFAGTAAAARRPGVDRYAGAPLGIALADPVYAVAGTATLAATGGTYGSYAEAAEAAGPGSQVVGAYEVAP